MTVQHSVCSLHHMKSVRIPDETDRLLGDLSDRFNQPKAFLVAHAVKLAEEQWKQNGITIQPRVLAHDVSRRASKGKAA